MCDAQTGMVTKYSNVYPVHDVHTTRRAAASAVTRRYFITTLSACACIPVLGMDSDSPCNSTEDAIAAFHLHHRYHSSPQLAHIAIAGASGGDTPTVTTDRQKYMSPSQSDFCHVFSSVDIPFSNLIEPPHHMRAPTRSKQRRPAILAHSPANAHHPIVIPPFSPRIRHFAPTTTRRDESNAPIGDGSNHRYHRHERFPTPRGSVRTGDGEWTVLTDGMMNKSH